MQDIDQTIISQYATSPTIRGIIEGFNSYIDPSADLDLFYDQVWNIDTAVGWGLDVWGRILVVSRALQITTSGYFGFSGPDGMSGDSFDTLPMYNSGPLTTNYDLTDDAYRVLLIAKAAFNICDGSIMAINAILRELFGASGAAYVTDGLNMTMTYTFKFNLSPVDFAIVSQSGAIPRPTGVSVSVVQIP